MIEPQEPLKVLVVEDQKGIIFMFRRILEEDDLFQVLHACSREEVITIVEQFSGQIFAAIIDGNLDNTTTGADGAWAAEVMKDTNPETHLFGHSGSGLVEGIPPKDNFEKSRQSVFLIYDRLKVLRTNI